MNNKAYEIEKKFLVDFPELNKLNVTRRIEILQTYLNNGENQAQRRVRKIIENDNLKFTYTEKLFLTAVVRQEMEYEINRAEYERLIVQAREDCAPIEKVRYCFAFRDQLFELDTYPFSDKLAILELELNSPEQLITFPDNVNVIKEVTDDGLYSNAALATARAFPE